MLNDAKSFFLWHEPIPCLILDNSFFQLILIIIQYRKELWYKFTCLPQNYFFQTRKHSFLKEMLSGVIRIRIPPSMKKNQWCGKKRIKNLIIFVLSLGHVIWEISPKILVTTYTYEKISHVCICLKQWIERSLALNFAIKNHWLNPICNTYFNGVPFNYYISSLGGSLRSCLISLFRREGGGSRIWKTCLYNI